LWFHWEYGVPARLILGENYTILGENYRIDERPRGSYADWRLVAEEEGTIG
jgi:hypothetical protein